MNNPIPTVRDGENEFLISFLGTLVPYFVICNTLIEMKSFVWIYFFC